LLIVIQALDNSSCKAIASALSGLSAGIVISALLEELEHIVEKAKDKTDDQKAKAKAVSFVSVSSYHIA